MTGDVLIFAQGRGKHTETIFYVVRQNRLHPRERVISLEIEKGLQQIHGGGSHHSTPITLAALAAAGLLPWAAALSLLFLFTLSHTHVILNSHIALFVWCLFIGKWWILFFFPAAVHGSQWWLPSSSTKAAATCSTC